MFAIFCSLLFITAASAGDKAYVVFKKPTDKLESAIKNEIKTSDTLMDVVSLINDEFRLVKPLGIIFGGENGPLYDSEANKILVPYAFIEEIKGRFKNDNYSETGVSVAEATMDALMHTLFHELGHALISMYDLPVLGKEEDAVDGLATILLIEFYEGGEEIALSAADLFDMESEDVDEFSEEDFWDEHSLDVQRFYNTLCHVYGSNPNKYAHIQKEAGFSKDRAEFCVEEYENTLRSWFALLKPYFRHDK